MGHIHTEKTRIGNTPREWLKFGAEAAEYVNKVSGRADVVGYVGKGAGHGAPACWIPSIAEMEINPDVCFGEGFDPAVIGNVNDRKVQFDWPVPMGALIHEAYHAKYTRHDLKEIADYKDRFIANLVTWFEETRIESFAVRERPDDVPFLRACALKLVVGDLKEDENYAGNGIKAFSQLMLLTLGRIDAGVLTREDVGIVAEAAEEFFEADVLKRLRSVWVRAQQHDMHYSWDGLRVLAEEWVEILKDAEHDPADDSGDDIPDWLKELMQQMMGGDGENGDEGEDGESSNSDSGSGDSEAEKQAEREADKDTKVHDAPGKGEKPGILERMAEAAADAGQDDANKQSVRETRAAAREAKNAAAQEWAEHSSDAGEVYGRGTGPGGGYTDSRLIQERPATPKERAAAVALAKALEKAQYRDRVVVKASSITPPGRLNSKRAVAAAQQRSQGLNVTHEAWSRKMRKHTDDPSLTVGVLVDISGSMGYAMEPMASTAWILSEATRRVDGKCSMVYYGDSVFPTLMPGQHLSDVKVYSAPDGTEKFNKAFQALNGKINLLGGSGARLLVVVSDIWYTGYERERTQYWMQRCLDAGVGVVVLPFDGESYARMNLSGVNCEVIPQTRTRTPLGAAQAVGEAALKQLRQAQSAY